MVYDMLSLHCVAVAVAAAAVAVAITATTTTRVCSSLHWLIVVLLSTIHFRHHILSCDPLTLSLPAAFAANCHPPPPAPPPPSSCCCCRAATTATANIVVSRLTHHCTLTKKEAVAAPPPAYQLQHHCENIYKSRQLGLI